MINETKASLLGLARLLSIGMVFLAVIPKGELQPTADLPLLTILGFLSPIERGLTCRSRSLDHGVGLSS